MARFVLPIYFTLVISSAVLAGVRLSEAMVMPGLQTIELVLLALPWSLALGIKPFAHADLGGMAFLVILGVLLNGIVLQSMVRAFTQTRIRLRQ